MDTLKPNLIKLISVLVLIIKEALDGDYTVEGNVLNLLSEKELSRILLELSYKTLDAVRSLIFRYQTLGDEYREKERLIVNIAKQRDEKTDLYIGAHELLVKVMTENVDRLPQMIEIGEDRSKFEELLDKNRRIEAIKILRYHYNLGLKEAKDLVDTYIDYVLRPTPF